MNYPTLTIQEITQLRKRITRLEWMSFIVLLVLLIQIVS